MGAAECGLGPAQRKKASHVQRVPRVFGQRFGRAVSSGDVVFLRLQDGDCQLEREVFPRKLAAWGAMDVVLKLEA